MDTKWLELIELSIILANIINREIIDPFMNKIKFHNKEVQFSVDNYRNHPLCFWNVIFINKISS